MWKNMICLFVLFVFNLIFKLFVFNVYCIVEEERVSLVVFLFVLMNLVSLMIFIFLFYFIVN